MICDIYLLDVSSLTVCDRLLQQLSTERQKKIKAYKHEKGQRLSLGAGLLLDHALQQYGLRERDVQYIYGPHGKPELNLHNAQQPLHFNLSHSADIVACAIAPCPVGVDIECTSRRVSAALLKRVCSPAEQEAIQRNPLTFFELWTAKEAVLKMTGEGINGDLTAIDISSATTWHTPKGYALSVSTHHPIDIQLHAIDIT